jgi:hypothetical protein
VIFDQPLFAFLPSAWKEREGLKIGLLVNLESSDKGLLHLLLLATFVSKPPEGAYSSDLGGLQFNFPDMHLSFVIKGFVSFFLGTQF